MRTKEEFIKEIIKEVRSRLNTDWYDAALTDGNGKKARISYGYDQSTGNDGMDENYLTNFGSWEEREEWDEYDMREDEVIDILEGELGLFLTRGVNQYGDGVFVDCMFEDGFDPEKRDYIEDNCIILYDDYEIFQDELNEMNEDISELFKFTELDESEIIKRRGKIETDIEFILRNKIDKPVKGEITPGKLKRRGIKYIVYGPGNTFIGVLQRGKVIGMDGEVQPPKSV